MLARPRVICHEAERGGGCDVVEDQTSRETQVVTYRKTARIEEAVCRMEDRVDDEMQRTDGEWPRRSKLRK